MATLMPPSKVLDYELLHYCMHLFGSSQLVSSGPHPVGGPKFSGQLVEPNQTFGWSLVDRFLPLHGKADR